MAWHLDTWLMSASWSLVSDVIRRLQCIQIICSAAGPRVWNSLPLLFIFIRRMKSTAKSKKQAYTNKTQK